MNGKFINPVFPLSPELRLFLMPYGLEGLCGNCDLSGELRPSDWEKLEVIYCITQAKAFGYRNLEYENCSTQGPEGAKGAFSGAGESFAETPGSVSSSGGTIPRLIIML